jgi:hypothetical protein
MALTLGRNPETFSLALAAAVVGGLWGRGPIRAAALAAGAWGAHGLYLERQLGRDLVAANGYFLTGGRLSALRGRAQALALRKVLP